MGARYRVPFNTVASSANVATPEDKFVVRPNSDTPYPFFWVDLRAEPVVATMPEIEKNRYNTGQMIDLYISISPIWEREVMATTAARS